LIVRETAASLLADKFAGDVELLPLDCPDAELFAVNVLRVVDALDLDRSVVERFSSGRIMTIDAPAFIPSRLVDTAIFKIPQMLRGPVYVTDDFVTAIKDHDLCCIDFRLVWAGDIE